MSLLLNPTSSNEEGNSLVEDRQEREEEVVNSSYNDQSLNMENNSSLLPSKSPLPQNVFTPEKVEELTKFYEKVPYPNKLQIQELSRQLNIPEKSVRMWISRHRYKIKQKKKAALPDRFGSSSGAWMIESENLGSTEPSQQQKILTAEKVTQLKEYYEKIPYPNKIQINELAQQLEMEEMIIRKWFINHRSKIRHENKAFLNSDNSNPSEITPIPLPPHFIPPEKKAVLKNFYETVQYPDKNQVQELAQQLDMQETAIKRWFDRQRHKTRLEQNTASNPFAQSNTLSDGTPTPIILLPSVKKIPMEKKILLKKFYEIFQYPNNNQLRDLARRLNIEKNSIQKWFYRQRFNDRKKFQMDFNSSDQQTTFHDNSSVINFFPPKKLTFTPEAEEFLKKFYENVQYPNRNELNFLAEKLNAEEKIIKNWFVKQRSKVREMYKTAINPHDETNNHDDNTTVIDCNNSIQNLPPLPQKKRIIAPEVEKELEKIYENVQYPDKDQIKVLAEQLAIDDRSLRKWFRDYRSKVRKMHKSAANTFDQLSGLDSSAQPNLPPFPKKDTLDPEKENELKKFYEIEKRPDKKDICELVEKLSLEEAEVQKWFKRQRMKDRRRNKAVDNSIAQSIKDHDSSAMNSDNVNSPRSILSSSYRSMFPVEKEDELKKFYERIQCPSKKEIRELAKQLNLVEVFIKKWFMNRRSKDRRRSKKLGNTSVHHNSFTNRLSNQPTILQSFLLMQMKMLNSSQVQSLNEAIFDQDKDNLEGGQESNMAVEQSVSNDTTVFTEHAASENSTIVPDSFPATSTTLSQSDAIPLQFLPDMNAVDESSLNASNFDTDSGVCFNKDEHHSLPNDDKLHPEQATAEFIQF